MLGCLLGCFNRGSDLDIFQVAEKGKGEMNPCRVYPTYGGQITRRPVDDLAERMLQGLILFERDKGACHAANRSSSSSEPSMVSTSIRCSEMVTSLSFFSRRILSAVS